MSFKSFPPIFDEQCRLLILGSFPSVKSREVSFYYGNKQNRFWGVLEEALGLDKFAAPSDKAAFLLERHIALWDVVCECEIKGSSDSSLVCLKPNEVDRLIKGGSIKTILCNGTTAFKLLNRYFPAEKSAGFKYEFFSLYFAVLHQSINCIRGQPLL